MKKPLFAVLLVALSAVSMALAPRLAEPRFTRDFCLDHCTFSTAVTNEFLPLEPGRFVILEGAKAGRVDRLEVRVLDQVRIVGGIPCRVVAESHFVDGALEEVVELAYATDVGTRNVYLMAEAVDLYADGEVVGHDGSWEAFVGGAKPGLAMPGTILVGARYVLQEVPGITEDRAEILEHPEPAKTPAGVFQACVKVEETSALEKDEVVIKAYAPGVGIVKDGHLKAIAHN